MHPHLMSPFYECVFGDPVATTCGVDKDGLELDFGSLSCTTKILLRTRPSLGSLSRMLTPRYASKLGSKVYCYNKLLYDCLVRYVC